MTSLSAITSVLVTTAATSLLMASSFRSVGVEAFGETFLDGPITSVPVSWEFLLEDPGGNLGGGDDDGIGNSTLVEATSLWLAITWSVESTGWTGFGLSGSIPGVMADSDMAIFEAADGGTLSDYHTVASANRKPREDSCSHWELVGFSLPNPPETSTMTVTIRRLVDTLDPQDWVATTDGPIGMITAWGDQPTFAYHGSDNASGSADLFENVREDFEVVGGGGQATDEEPFGTTPDECFFVDSMSMEMTFAGL
jgi:DOMON domain